MSPRHMVGMDVTLTQWSREGEAEPRPPANLVTCSGRDQPSGTWPWLDGRTDGESDVTTTSLRRSLAQ